jgi:O-antigen biosynthesis protein WbqP
MIRLLDIFFSLFGILVLFPLFIIIWIILFLSNGSPIFKQTRVGYNQKLFTLIKFRTMPLQTKLIATHLIKNLNLSFFCIFLRKSKLDEIPQLWNVLIGEMSFVGPRPCLLNQRKLIKERKKRGAFKVRPGITGLAQITSITMQKPTLVAMTDLEMIRKFNFYYYFYYIFKTFPILLKKL